MIKLKINSKDYSNIFFSSDFHLNHQRDFLWKPRGFKDAQEHTDFLRHHIRQLPFDALLVFLGDFALNSSCEFVQQALAEIPCKTIMLWGNHNSGVIQLYHEQVSQGTEVYPIQLNERVLMVGDSLFLQIDGRLFFCSHFAPMTWDKMNKGIPALCGHSHGNLKCANPLGTECGKILDVGVDNALKYNNTPFFSLKEVDTILNKKQIVVIDHHS
jgi:calcineurin-like phosphoesterase family protein